MERITKVMMMALIGIMVVLGIHSLLLPGASEGVAFYLLPNPENFMKAGVRNVVYGALNQSFFTLSLGMGGMLIFGSYIGKEHSLAGEAVVVAALDTFVAIVAGLITIPACFTYGIAPDHRVPGDLRTRDLFLRRDRMRLGDFLKSVFVYGGRDGSERKGKISKPLAATCANILVILPLYRIRFL